MFQTKLYISSLFYGKSKFPLYIPKILSGLNSWLKLVILKVNMEISPHIDFTIIWISKKRWKICIN